MPYKTNKDLPENVTHVLPAHAQDIYREAFNPTTILKVI
jgi:cation transport regulator